MRKMAIASVAIGDGLRAIICQLKSDLLTTLQNKDAKTWAKILKIGQYYLNFEQKCILDVWDMSYSEQTWKRLRCFGKKY